MASASPAQFPGLYDAAVIGGIPIGPVGVIAEVVGGGDPRKIDEKTGYGQDGSAPVYVGRTLSKFTLKLTFWTAEALDYYHEVLLPAISPPPTAKNTNALDFFHAYVSNPPHNITSVLVEDIGQLIQTDPGVWVAEIKLMRFVKPKPAVGKPGASKSTPKKKTAKDDADLEIEALTAQVKSLAND